MVNDAQPLALAGGQVNAVEKATLKSIEAMKIAKRIRRLRMFRSMIVPFPSGEFEG